MTGTNHVYHFKHGWIPIDSYAANIKLQRTQGGARKLAGAAGGIEEDPKLTTLVNLREMGHSKYEAVLQRHQAEHGAKTSAETIAERVHNPGVRRVEPSVKPMSTAEQIAARVAGTPTSHLSSGQLSGEQMSHVAAAMDRGKFPEAMRQPMIDALSHQAKYPGLIEQARTFEVMRKGVAAEASATFGGHVLYVSPGLLDADGERARGRRVMIAKGRHGGAAAGTVNVKAETEGRVSGADVTVAHEMGHAVESMMTQGERVDALTAAARKAGLPLPTPVMVRMDHIDGGAPIHDHNATIEQWTKSPQVKSFLRTNLSPYGASASGEAWAEMWAVYSLDGADAPAWVRAFGDTATAAMARRAAGR